MEQPRPSTPQGSTASPPQRSGLGHPIALCLHEVPGEDPHFDLFLAPSEPFDDQDRVLRSWRLPCSPLALQPGESVAVVPIGTHRGCYARLQAPMQPSNGQGVVTPVLSGDASCSDSAQGVSSLDVVWDDGSQTSLTLSPATEDNPAQLTRIA